jgi:hypothetical protein
MRRKVCRHCRGEFDLDSPRKRRVGGYINECPDCVEERGGDDSPPRYLGVQAGDGKMSGLTILAFESERDRAAYSAAWRSCTGAHKGKSSHLSPTNTPMTGLRFRKVGENRGNANHKGRADGSEED